MGMIIYPTFTFYDISRILSSPPFCSILANKD